MKLANGNYIRPASRFSWWLSQSSHIGYMVREVSSLYIGLYTLMMVWGLYQLSLGEAQFNAWSKALWEDSFVVSATALLFAIYHSYSWFIMTPKAMPLKIAGKRVAGAIIVGAHFLGWLVCSVITWVLFVNGGVI